MKDRQEVIKALKDNYLLYSAVHSKLKDLHAAVCSDSGVIGSDEALNSNDAYLATVQVHSKIEEAVYWASFTRSYFKKRLYMIDYNANRRKKKKQ